jgi:hypothetical protein
MPPRRGDTTAWREAGSTTPSRHTFCRGGIGYGTGAGMTPLPAAGAGAGQLHRYPHPHPHPYCGKGIARRVWVSVTLLYVLLTSTSRQRVVRRCSQHAVVSALPCCFVVRLVIVDDLNVTSTCRRIVVALLPRPHDTSSCLVLLCSLTSSILTLIASSP